MATLSINTPAEQAISRAVQAVSITDARGRNITLKKPGVLAQFRFIEALGDTAQNQVYMAMAMPLIFVAEIDGDPVVMPTRKSEIEALIQRLDEDGIAAVQTGVSDHFKASTPEQDKAAVKN